MNRRDLLKLSALGVGVAFLPRIARAAGNIAASSDDVFFVQLSDTHLGYHGPANPEADVELERAIAAVNALPSKPMFAVFTGDLTNDTDDAVERKARMTKFKQIVSTLNVPEVHFLAGEHDVQKDQGATYRDVFGEPRFSFERQGTRFVGIDNSLGSIGDTQLAWLDAELAKSRSFMKAKSTVVFAHRPLFDLDKPWDWFTADGAKAIAILEKHGGATVFYGHIHQEHHVTTGTVQHHAARSLVFPLAKPFSQEKRAPVPWDAAASDHGLGFRTVHASSSSSSLAYDDVPLIAKNDVKPAKAAPPASESGW